MGYTSGHEPMFHPDMQQTPENVAKVLDIAGWTVQEAAAATGIQIAWIVYAQNGRFSLSKSDWQKLLDVAGRRAFDWEEAE